MSAEVNAQASGNPVIDHLDLWSSVYVRKATTGRGSNVKVSPYGIQKLRELILELAVRGKLVPQDPNDEPSSVLLEKIAEEKARLVKEGKLKKQKKLPRIGDEQPHNLPENWEWMRLGAVTNYGVTEKANPGDVDDDVWVLELEDVEKVTSRLLKRIRYSERPFKSAKNRFEIGDVLYGKLRPYLDKVLVADESGVCTTEIIPIRSYAGFVSEYLRLLLKAPSFIIYANESTHGMNLPRLGTDKARLALIPVAPAAEQHRIVAKVNELMALCDHLEQQQTDSLQAHQTLVETLLRTLVDASDAESTQQAWSRIAEHFDTLFTTEASIDQLKQTILQLAVMGKLVPQDPNDEPASVLLEKIAEEQAGLIKEGKIRKKIALLEISTDEKLFDLPFGWEWVRLGALSPDFQNGASSRGDKEGKETVVLRLADIDNWRISLAEPRSLTIAESSINKYSLEKNDVLIIRVNGSADIVGRFVLCDREIKAIYCDHFIRMRFPVQALVPAYLELLGSSSLVRQKINDLFVSTAGQKTVNQKHIGSLAITLPPLAEQHRIVAKVNELMALCDTLKARIQDAQTAQVHLADAVVEQAVA
ncbi:MAG: type I restriction endonuclease subunit S [endosymbiont of Escarpia spicata]|uniref:Type I restriction endonuclease subunit S n=1 Tax=endosymbiont of Escarpia spicata TaxID=2200908 RepID=A0A370DHH2_9GAMM|nr:MAG: type I restriction endonuclease subunit S [endosymbiont of Escarpia spicata]